MLHCVLERESQEPVVFSRISGCVVNQGTGVYIFQRWVNRLDDSEKRLISCFKLEGRRFIKIIALNKDHLHITTQVESTRRVCTFSNLLY